jgi:hypothetical protein
MRGGRGNPGMHWVGPDSQANPSWLTPFSTWGLPDVVTESQPLLNAYGTAPHLIIGPDGKQHLIGPHGVQQQVIIGPDGKQHLIGPDGIRHPQYIIGPDGKQHLIGPDGIRHFPPVFLRGPPETAGCAFGKAYICGDQSSPYPLLGQADAGSKVSWY